MAVPDHPSDALAARVQAAVETLGRRERAALELCERDGTDYAGIARELDVRREGVADLLVTARLAVEAGLRDGPAPERGSGACGPSRRVLVARQDGETVSPADLGRAQAHVTTCADCQEARRALVEAGLVCRAWGAVPAQQLPAEPPRAPALPARPRASVAQLVRRNRAAVAAVAALALLAIVLALAGGSGGDSAPKPINPPSQGSADAPGRDVVPPPGDQFCASGEPGCP